MNFEFSYKQYGYYIFPREDLRSNEACNQVLKSRENIRFSDGKGVSLVDPLTGEVFTIGARRAEIYSEESRRWEELFLFKTHKILVSTRFEPGDELSEMWTNVSWFAQKLDGKLLGERGEEYDILTGKVINDGQGNKISYGWAKENNL